MLRIVTLNGSTKYQAEIFHPTSSNVVAPLTGM